MLNELRLLSGNDIPFFEAQIIIHQPTIKEIGLIGEETFYSGCGVLNFSKDNLSEQDRINLGNKTNFEILMSMIMDKSHPVMREHKVNATSVLALMFPDYEIRYTHNEIQFIKEDEVHSINSMNFEKFKEILTAMFCLKGRGDDAELDYNPGGKLAKGIAEKLYKRRQIVAEQKGEQKIAVLSRYVSILSVGERKDMNDLLKYTVYQLFDEYDRFELKEQYDMHFRAQLAGARDLQEVDNWRKDIHP